MGNPDPLHSPEMRQLMVAYLDLLRFQVRLATAMREATGEPIRTFDTVVNLEVWVFPDTLQQEIINSLDAPKTSTRDSLARLVRAGFVTRDGKRYRASADTLGFVDRDGGELIRLLFRACDAVTDYQKVYGRLPPL